VGFQVPQATLLQGVSIGSPPVDLGEARVYAIYFQRKLGDFRTSAAAWVRVRCEQ